MEKTIVFDLGGVLIDWNPKYLYKNVFKDDDQMNYFLDNICTGHWNELQDAGRGLQEATDILVSHFPEHEQNIRLFYSDWEKMLHGSISDTVTILESLKNQNFKLLALTNWSNETFPIAIKNYEFLHWFDGILVSGKEKLIKPDPAIFNLLLKRYHLEASRTIFIDDNPRNVLSAQNLGIDAIQFYTPKLLIEELNIRMIKV